MIQAGETLSFTLDFGIHTNEESVQTVISEVDELQKTSALNFVRKPPATE